MLNKNDPLVGAIQDIMSKNQAERDAVKAVNEKFGVQDRRVLPREKQGEWDAAYQTILTEGVEALDEAKLTPEHKKAITQTLRKNWEEPKGRVKFSKDSLGGHHATISSDKQGMELTHSITFKNGKVSVSGSPHTEAQLEEEALEEMSTKQKMLARVGAKVNPEDNPKTIGKDDLRAARQGHASHIGEDQDPSVKFQKMPYIVKKGEKKTPLTPMPNAPLKPSKDKFVNAVKLEEDETPMTKMGIKKPDYAPEGEIPDYAKTKEQTPNRTAKTSLPAGTMKEAMMNKIMKKLQEGSMKKTMGEFKRGKLHSGSNTGPIVTDRDQAIAIGMNSKKTVSEEGFSDQKGSPNEKIKSVFSNMFSNFTKPADPAKINSAWSKPNPEPAKSSAPVPSRNSPEGGNRPPQGSVPNPQDRINDLGKAGVPGTGIKLSTNRESPKPAAKPPIPRLRPANDTVKKAASNVKPAAQKLKDVRKQPPAGAAPRPVNKYSTINKMRRDRQANKNNDPVGPGN